MWVWCEPHEAQTQNMTLVFGQPPLWRDKLSFAQFHAVQCFDLSLSFLIEQQLQKKIKIEADGKRIDNKRLLLDAWREFLRRATSCSPPFFIILVSLAEVAAASVRQWNKHWEDQRGCGPVVPYHPVWVGLITVCLSGPFHPPRCIFSDAVGFIFLGPLFCFSLLPFLSVPTLLNIPMHHYGRRGFSWFG